MFLIRIILQLAGITIVLAGILTGVPNPAAKNKNIDDYFSSFPSVPTGAKAGSQTYRLEYRFYNRDVYGNTFSKIFTTGLYSRGLKGGGVRWNNVRIASPEDPDGPFPEGTTLGAMEDFTYTISQEIVKEAFYDRFPGGDLRHLIKTMVWDGVMIDVFDGMIGGLGLLPLNEFRRVAEFEDFDVRMCDWGNLQMKDLRIKWSGITKINGELCALIYYRSFSNPVNAMAVKGRSLYWGHVWISIEDQDIECLTLNEDVILELPAGNGEKKLWDAQREVKFNKLTETPR